MTETVSLAPPEAAEAEVEGDFLTRLVQTLGVGVAVVDPESWSVEFENAKFFQWFPPGEGGEETVDARVPGFNAERALDRLSNRRPYRIECEAKQQARTVSVVVELKALSEEEGGKVLVECSDVLNLKQKK